MTAWSTGALLRHAWSESVHGGWEFGTFAGPPLLEWVADEVGVRSHTRLLHLGREAGGVVHYLALRHGCAITALEPDEVRLTRARRRLRELPQPAARRVRLVAATPGRWSPQTWYDVALAVEPSGGGADLGPLVELAHEALRPDGHFVLADVVRGPEAGREPPDDVLWTLTAPDRLTRRLLRAGFVDVRLVDATGQAIDALQKLQANLDRQYRRMRALAGPPPTGAPAGDGAGGGTLLNLTLDVLDRLRGGRLAYVRATARRPPSRFHGAPFMLSREAG